MPVRVRAGGFQQLSAGGRNVVSRALNPPVKRLPIEVSIATHLLVPSALIFSLYVVENAPPTIADDLFLIPVGSVLAICMNSMLRGPQQFFRALTERVIRPFVYVWAFCLIYLSLVQWFVSRIGRLLIAAVVSLIYGISPIDLIPDFILGLGQLDDIAVIILMFYWALFGTSIAFNSALKGTARRLISDTRIRTRFP